MHYLSVIHIFITTNLCSAFEGKMLEKEDIVSFLDYVLSLFTTLGSYLFIPIFILLSGKKLSRRAIKVLVFLNSGAVYCFWGVCHYFYTGSPPNFTACLLWGSISFSILKKHSLATSSTVSECPTGDVPVCDRPVDVTKDVKRRKVFDFNSISSFFMLFMLAFLIAYIIFLNIEYRNLASTCSVFSSELSSLEERQTQLEDSFVELDRDVHSRSESSSSSSKSSGIDSFYSRPLRSYLKK